MPFHVVHKELSSHIHHTATIPACVYICFCAFLKKFEGLSDCEIWSVIHFLNARNVNCMVNYYGRCIDDKIGQAVQKCEIHVKMYEYL